MHLTGRDVEFIEGGGGTAGRYELLEMPGSDGNVGKLADRVTVELPGGTVAVRWEGPGSSVWLTGEAVTVFEGTVQV